MTTKIRYTKNGPVDADTGASLMWDLTARGVAMHIARLQRETAFSTDAHPSYQEGWSDAMTTLADELIRAINEAPKGSGKDTMVPLRNVYNMINEMYSNEADPYDRMFELQNDHTNDAMDELKSKLKDLEDDHG